MKQADGFNKMNSACLNSVWVRTLLSRDDFDMATQIRDIYKNMGEKATSSNIERLLYMTQLANFFFSYFDDTF